MALIPNLWNQVDYHALSTDISDDEIDGASWVGAMVYITDTGQRYVVSASKVLVPYYGEGTGYTTAAETIITAGSTTGSLIAANDSRKYLFIQNHSDAEDIHVSSSASATTDSPKIAAGGNQELSGYTLYRGAIQVIKSGSQVVTVAVVEGT